MARTPRTPAQALRDRRRMEAAPRISTSRFRRLSQIHVVRGMIDSVFDHGVATYLQRTAAGERRRQVDELWVYAVLRDLYENPPVPPGRGLHLLGRLPLRNRNLTSAGEIRLIDEILGLLIKSLGSLMEKGGTGED